MNRPALRDEIRLSRSVAFSPAHEGRATLRCRTPRRGHGTRPELTTSPQ